MNRLVVLKIVTIMFAVLMTAGTIYAIYKVNVEYIVLGFFMATAAWFLGLQSIPEYQAELALDARLMAEANEKTATRNTAYGGGAR